MCEMEILRVMSDDEVDELMELYKTKYGTKNFHYLLMYNQRKWDHQLKDRNADKKEKKWIELTKTFYTHRSKDFRTTGTYISLHYDMMQSVSIHCWATGIEDLNECLEKTNLIKWHDGPLFTNVDLYLCDKVKEVAASKGVTVQRARKCAGLLLEHEKALNLQPDQPSAIYTMEPLHIDDADLIHSLWTNQKEGSFEYIQGLIELNKTLGIRRNTDNKLIAWIFENDFSGLGILQVLPEIQRQGFGKILIENLSQIIAKTEDVHITAWIVIDNIRSSNLLNKVGFRRVVINEWIQLNKKI